MTTPVYTTKEAVKALLPNNSGSIYGTSIDAVLTTMIAVASREIDAHLKRRPGAFGVDADAVGYFDGSGSKSLYIGELAAVPTVVSVAESGVVDDISGTGGEYTTWSNSDFFGWPSNAFQEGMPLRRLDLNLRSGSKSIWYQYPRAVKITGKFGYSTSSNMPDEIVKATSIQTMRYYKRAQQAFADAGATPNLKELVYVKKLDPDVQNILQLPKFASPWI